MASLVSKDYYLNNRDRLENQPKRAIAEYVEKNGILVPRRFSSFAEAKAAAERGTKVLARSEHAQDYDGVSGLLDSVQVRPGATEEQILRDITYADLRGLATKWLVDPLKIYCDFLGMTPQGFSADVSASYWEFIEGFNLGVVADSAITGRYHITPTEGTGNKRNIIVDNGSVSSFGECKFLHDPESNRRIMRIIELYERIRNLDRFDPNHCPIIEIQSTEDKDYFLQYLRTRDFEPSTFELGRDARGKELPAQFVRGSTKDAEGEVVPVLAASSSGINSRDQSDCEGKGMMFGFNHISDFIIADYLSRHVRLQVFKSANPDIHSAMGSLSHLDRSIFFKPYLSVMSDARLMDRTECDRLADLAKRTGQNQYVNMHVVSDGRRALIERVD